MGRVSYSGTFREVLELNNFPFDIQWLHVKFEVQQQGCVMRHKNFLKGNRLEILQQKWLNGSFTLLEVDMATHTAEDKPGKSVTTMFVACKVSRKSFGVCMRTMFVMFLVILASLCPFALDPVSSLQDRLGLIFTMMLTAAAYATVVADSLPSLGYLTFLDMYILMSFAFFVVEAVQACIVGMLGAIPEDGYVNRFMLPVLEAMADKDFRDLDCICIIFNLSFIFIFHALATIYVIFFAIPVEARKRIDNPLGDDEDNQPELLSTNGNCCIPRAIPSDDEDMVLSRPLMGSGNCTTGDTGPTQSSQTLLRSRDSRTLRPSTS